MRTRKNETRPAADPISTIMSSLLSVHAALSIDWLVDAASTAAERVLGAPFAYVFVEDQDGRLEHKAPASDLRRRSLQRVNDAFSKDLFRRRIDPRDVPAFADALDGGKPVLSSFEEFFRSFAPVAEVTTAERALGAHKAIIAPIETAGERIGALLVLATGDADLEHARLLGEHIACAAVNLRQASAGREEIPIDVSRSVFDTHKLESELRRELGRAQRYSRNVSIVVVQATNLRLLRERFGGFLTDRLLQRLGEALAAHSREIDVIGSYKDSGYAMVLTEASAQDAEVAAARLLAAAQDIRLDGDDVPGLELHMVAGHATFPGDGATTDALFATVERRMYETDATHVA
jgi:diguanylate cyclase (GGDEF)-like protein